MYEDRIVARGEGERREGDVHKLSDTQISNQMSSSRIWLFIFIFSKSNVFSTSQQAISENEKCVARMGPRN
jgi:hypothetical protein